MRNARVKFEIWILITDFGIFSNLSTVWDIVEMSSETLDETREITGLFFYLRSWKLDVVSLNKVSVFNKSSYWEGFWPSCHTDRGQYWAQRSSSPSCETLGWAFGGQRSGEGWRVYVDLFTFTAVFWDSNDNNERKVNANSLCAFIMIKWQI